MIRVPEVYRDIAADLKNQGWTGPEMRNGGHLVWISPDGAVVIASASPSDHRSRQALTTQLRQAGAAIDGRGSTRGNGQAEEDQLPEPGPAPAAAVPVPSGPAEPAGLRELVSEARQVLAELRAERKEIDRLITEGAATLIADQVASELETFDMKRLLRRIEDHVYETSQAAIDKFGQGSEKILRAFDRAASRRIQDADDAVKELRIISDVWKAQLDDRGTGIPPAYRRRPK